MEGVENVEVLSLLPSEVRLRVLYRHATLLPVLRKFQVTVSFPLVIRAGEVYWVVAARERKMRRILYWLSERAVTVHVESVGPAASSRAGELLTSRQKGLLQRAIDAGYFEVPRKTSLTRLATREGMAASSLSESLAISEKKIIALRPWALPDRSDAS